MLVLPLTFLNVEITAGFSFCMIIFFIFFRLNTAGLKPFRGKGIRGRGGAGFELKPWEGGRVAPVDTEFWIRSPL